MHAIDKATCRNIAYFLLGTFALMNVGLFWLDVPIGNRESLGRSMATLENLLLIMAGFFYGASLSKNQPGVSDASVLESSQVRVTEPKTKEEIKPKEGPTA